MRPDDVMPPMAVLDDEPFSDADVAAYFDKLDRSVTESDHAYAETLPVSTWQVTNDDEAEWAARKLAAADAAMREIEMRAHDYVARIQAWADECMHSDRRTADVMRGKLLDYALRERVEHGRATIKLPSAEFGTSASAPKVVVDSDDVVFAAWESLNADRLVAWSNAMANAEIASADLLHTSHKVYVTPLRKLVTIDERQHGYDVEIVLACGHTLTLRSEAIDDPDVPTVGEIIMCRVGDVEQAVEHVEFVPHVEHVVVGPDGEIVPGCSIDPGGVSPKEIKLR